MNRIKKIAFFGYGYPNHNEEKWYAVAQYMIWKTADQVNGEVYFTSGLNGPKIVAYQAEIQEIENLIESYDKKLNIEDRIVYLIEGRAMNIYVGEEMSRYHVISNEFKTRGDYLVPKTDVKEGEYRITFHRSEDNFENPIIFYQSSNSQNLVQRGNLEDKTVYSTVKVIKTKIIVHKIDEDTGLSTPQGNASLDGTIITLYDSRNNKIGDYTIQNGEVSIEDLDIGTYYIEEKEPGEGYHKNKNRIEVSLTLEDSKKEVTLTNKVIEKKVKIIKMYGEENNMKQEANIDFEVYDNKNNYLKTISTNQEGEVEIILPYGEYKIIQKTTTPGYLEVEPFEIKVEDKEDEVIELKDYRIIVPNTKSNKKTLLQYLLLLLGILIC